MTRFAAFWPVVLVLTVALPSPSPAQPAPDAPPAAAADGTGPSADSDAFDWDSLDDAEAEADDYDWDALDQADDAPDEAVDAVDDAVEDDEFDWDSLDDAPVDGVEAVETLAEEGDEFDWDSLDEDAEAEGDEFDWDSLDEDAEAEGDEFDWDSLDEDAEAEGDEFDWDSLDEDAEAEGDDFDWDSLDEDAEAADDEFDWDSLDDAEADDDEFDWDSLDDDAAAEDDGEFDWDALDDGDDEEDWDSYWDELDAMDEPVEDVVVPTEVAETEGGLQGVVIDDETGLPFVGANVSLSGTEFETRSDSAGRFYFDLEPGEYVLRVDHFELTAVSYQVLVEAGEITDLASIRMRPSANQMTVVVEGRAVQESTAQQLRERQDSTTVQDAVSAEQISQAGDSSAASAVRRVVGVTLVDDRFLVVRGLSGRYNVVTLNDVPVALTDPDYPSAEVDIFPTSLLAGLTLAKNPSADLTTFTGGLMDIQTRAYPEEFELKLSASLSGDTATTFRDFETDQLGSHDALGFDDGSRSWPTLPGDAEVDRRITEDYERIAHAFPNAWASEHSTARPNMGLKLNVGDSFDLANDRRFGYLLIAGYDNSLSRREGTRTSTTQVGGELVPVETLDTEKFESETTWSALANLSLELADGHTLRWMTMWNHVGRDRLSLASGDADEESGFLERSERQWLQRSLVFNQLSGSHRRLLPETSPFHETRIDWRGAFNLANREEPDTRYLKQVNGVWDVNPGSGEHFSSSLDQIDAFGGLDFELPYLDVVTTTVGASAAIVDRSFDSRRLRYIRGRDAIEQDFFSLPPDELFADENVTQSGNPLSLTEDTQDGDSYDASSRTLAGYGRLEVRPTPWLRLVAGVRGESFTQSLSARPIGDEPDPDDSVDRTDTDFLPSGAAIFGLRDDMFIRAIYAGSVARPQMREIAPFVSQDYVRRRTQTGNPDLIRTYIHNADLRWEWFPSPEEVVAVSVFYKGFLHPIEATLVNESDVRFLNADGSTNFGAELEAQVDLGRIGPRAAGLFVGANVAIVQSEIDLPCNDTNEDGECDQRYTNASRPMEGQAPWQVNARFGWDAPDNGFDFTLVFGALGRTLVDVGTDGKEDAYAMPTPQLDLTMGYDFNDHWSLGAKVRNLLLASSVERRDSVREVVNDRPLEFGLSVSWAY